MADRLRQIEGVADVSPSLVDTVGFEDKNLVSVLVNGWVPGEHPVPRHPHRSTAGPLQEGDEKVVMLGRVLALTLDKKAGDPLQIAGEPFQVVGIFESDSWFENGGMIMPLKTLQSDDGHGGAGHGLPGPGDVLGHDLHRRAATADRVDHHRVSPRRPRATTS